MIVARAWAANDPHTLCRVGCSASVVLAPWRADLDFVRSVTHGSTLMSSWVRVLDAGVGG